MVKKKSVFYVMSVVIACIILSFAGYALPVTENLTRNVITSAKQLMEEGDYPRVMNINNSELDNFTDAVILNISSYHGEERLTEKIFANYQWYSVEGGVKQKRKDYI